MLVLALGACRQSAVSQKSSLDFPDTLNVSWSVIENQDIVPYCDNILIKDSTILLSGKLDGHYIHRYTQNDGTLLDSHITIGQGPDEVIFPFCTSIFDDTLTLYDMRAKRVKMFDSDFKCVRSISTAEQTPVHEAWPLGADRMLLKVPLKTDDGKWYAGWRIVDLSNPTKIFASYDTIPDCVKRNPEALGVLITQTALSPDRRHFATGTTNGCVFQTFDISSDRFIPIISEYLFPIKFDKIGNGIPGTSFTGFTALCASNTCLYGAFAGSPDSNDANKIGVWSWDGVPRLLIQTDSRILNLAISESGNELFGVILRDDECLLAKIADLKQKQSQ